MQGEKLREQRQSLHLERQNTLREAERLQKLRDQLRGSEGSMSMRVSEQPGRVERIEEEVVSPHPQILQQQQVPALPAPAVPLQGSAQTPRRMIARTPSRLAWLQQCASKLFTSPSSLKTILGAPEGENEDAMGDDSNLNQLANRPSTSFTQSQLGQVVGTDEGPRSKRTRSTMEAVVEGGNPVVRPEGGGSGTIEEVSQVDGERQNGLDATVMTTPLAGPDVRTGKKRQRQLRSPEEGGNKLTDAEAVGTTQRKKKIKDILVETETDADTPLQTPHSSVSTPAAKRYNFRSTTL